MTGRGPPWLARLSFLVVAMSRLAFFSPCLATFGNRARFRDGQLLSILAGVILSWRGEMIRGGLAILRLFTLTWGSGSSACRCSARDCAF